MKRMNQRMVSRTQSEFTRAGDTANAERLVQQTQEEQMLREAYD